MKRIGVVAREITATTCATNATQLASVNIIGGTSPNGMNIHGITDTKQNMILSFTMAATLQLAHAVELRKLNF